MTRFEVLAIRDTPQEDVVRAVQDLYRERGYGPPGPGGAVQDDDLRLFEISPQRERWVVAFPGAPGDHAEDAQGISRSLGTEVLQIRAEVGQEIGVALFTRGAPGLRYPGEGAAAASIAALGRTPEGQDEARRILGPRTDWQDYLRLGEALGIPGVKDFELMNDAMLDQEEAGYRHLTLRKPASFGLFRKVRQMLTKPDLAPRRPA